MSTTTRRAPKAPTGGSSGAASPLANATLVAGALAGAAWLLVQRGRMSWPPSELLASTYTVAGCLALIGPILLARREAAEGGLGELLWMTAGVLCWIYNAAALVRGEIRGHAWATPLAMAPMGLTVLAVLLAGWRLRSSSARTWAWTNVVGWILGAYWVGMALYAMAPAAGPSLVAR